MYEPTCFCMAPFPFLLCSASLLPSQDPGGVYYKLSSPSLVILSILTPALSGQILLPFLQQKQKQINALSIPFPLLDNRICSFFPNSNIQQDIYPLFPHFLLILIFLPLSLLYLMCSHYSCFGLNNHFTKPNETLLALILFNLTLFYPVGPFSPFSKLTFLDI